MKIFHAADIHLGRKRLDGRLPDSDIASAFEFIAREAIREKADVFLLAGDLFDRPQVEPPHLRQAQEVLALLKSAGIPVIAIEGNHDRHFVNTNIPTWVNFLAEDDLLILLRPEFDAEGARIECWDAVTRRGAYFEVGGIRFVGAGYLGAATPHKIRQMLAVMDGAAPQVLLLHAGPEYFVGEGGGFSKEDLQALEQRICYLALGHIHKPMLHKGWACNPGSPENCDLREASYSRGKDGVAAPRGFAVVEIDPSNARHPVSVEIRSNPRRPCQRIELDCSPFGSKTKNGVDAFVAAAVMAVRQSKADSKAVVEIVLQGSLDLNRIALDPLITGAEIARAADVFAVSIDSAGLNIFGGNSVRIGAGLESISREELERNAIRHLVSQNALWGLDEDNATFADLFYELKQGVGAGQEGEVLASKIAASPLVEKVRIAIHRAAAPSEGALL